MIRNLVLRFSALAVIAFSSSTPPRQSLPPALVSLVDAERAFARMSVDRGRRAAFLAFFDEDALFFTPKPTRAKPSISKWPETGPFVLDWEPRFGDVSAAGDLGYTTGPYERTVTGGSEQVPRKTVESGWYFTLWRNVGGSWKVIIDVGTSSPASGALRSEPFRRRPNQAGSDPQVPTVPLAAADQSFCDRIIASGFVQALAAVGTDGTIVFREGVGPLTEAAMVRSYLASRRDRLACRPARNQLAASVDFGYSYGEYSTEGSSQEAGYYLRVWKHRSGAWRLAVDLLIPAPRRDP